MTRIAIVKYGGLASAGTERWLQIMSAGLCRRGNDISYFYCDAGPYIGSRFVHPQTDMSRHEFLVESGVDVRRFSVTAKDVTTADHRWVDTDFWDVFDEGDYDLVLTAGGGEREYPYYLMRLPVIRFVALGSGVDRSGNVVCSIHPSQYQRARWLDIGGRFAKSVVIPVPAERPAVSGNLRSELNLSANATVLGFHQRRQDEIFSSVPLEAYARIERDDTAFLIMGGSDRYRDQARELGLANVRFLPHSGDRNRISLFLNTLDIFAHGRADGETYGTVFAEAMMHGLPCISHWSPSDNGQFETMGGAGRMASGPDDYARQLVEMVGSRELRGHLGDIAKDRARQWFDIEPNIDRLEEVIRAIVSGRPWSLPEPPIRTRGGRVYPGDVLESYCARAWLNCSDLSTPVGSSYGHTYTESYLLGRFESEHHTRRKCHGLVLNLVVAACYFSRFAYRRSKTACFGLADRFLRRHSEWYRGRVW